MLENVTLVAFPEVVVVAIGVYVDPAAIVMLP
jgi:hypothetical protein